MEVELVFSIFGSVLIVLSLDEVDLDGLDPGRCGGGLVVGESNDRREIELSVGRGRWSDERGATTELIRREVDG